MENSENIYQQPTPQEIQENRNANRRQALAGLGNVGGWIYAAKTGGGFWRYLGWGLVGGVAGYATGTIIFPNSSDNYYGESQFE